MGAQRLIPYVIATALMGSMCMAQSANTYDQSQDKSQSTPSSMSHGSTTKSPDHAFIMKAAQGGMAEVSMGNLAKQNGNSDAVRQFGDRMVTDHSQANDQLKQLAQQKGITLPADVSMKDKATSKMLESKKGTDFDKAYVSDMVKDHETDVAEFRREAENGKDPDVKAWAQKTLPVLEQHLASAKQIASQMGVDTTKKSASAMSSQQQ